MPEELPPPNPGGQSARATPAPPVQVLQVEVHRRGPTGGLSATAPGRPPPQLPPAATPRPHLRSCLPPWRRLDQASTAGGAGGTSNLSFGIRSSTSTVATTHRRSCLISPYS